MILFIPDVVDFEEIDSPGEIQFFAVRAVEETDGAGQMIFGSSSMLIQVKRGLDANLPAVAAAGEPLFTTDTHRFFIGTGAGVRELQGLSANGYLLITKNAAPADAELQPGQAALWFDPTNGSSGLKIKAKELDGSVVTASFSTA